MKKAIAIPATQSGIAARVAQLPSTPFAELKKLWAQLFDMPLPTHNRSYIERRVAYRMQELELAQSQSQLLASNRRRIDALLDQTKPAQKAGRGELVRLAPGTVLTRDFMGKTHRVVAMSDGQFEYGGKPYNSLTAIANEISGSRWSGPAFFGLRDAQKKDRKEVRMTIDPSKKRQRCAVYTRKSTEEGLDQDYNSIDAQRDAGHAYIASQRAEGWIPVADDYDDPAYSGGNMERPALKRLMADIERGLIDIVVVYKIDRLTRSLADFSKMVEVFERQGVSFVSVTQQFNTTTSMGRLMLNVLLSFAQFEREVTGERIRDKIAASKRKGIWMGGVPPLGYDVVARKLVINEVEAAVVRRMFIEYPRAGSTTLFVQQLRHEGVTSKSWKAQSGKDRVGKPIDKGALYKILNNPMYLGQIRHKGVAHSGEHEPIVTLAQWETVQSALASKPNGARKGQIRTERPALLKGLIYTTDGRAMTPHATKGRGGRLYRYYLSTRDAKEGHGASGVRMLPAGEIEEAVVAQLRGILRAPEMVAQVWREIATRDDAAIQGMTEMQVAVALSKIDIVWEQLFPLEQHRIVQLLVERIIVSPNELQVRLHPNGVENLALDVVRAAGRKAATVAEEALA